jgi:hypothetical protein
MLDRAADHQLGVALGPDRMEIPREDDVARGTHEAKLELRESELHRVGCTMKRVARRPGKNGNQLGKIGRLGRLGTVVVGCMTWLLASSGCGDPHWDAVRWPSQAQGGPAQPLSESAATAVALRAVAIEWEPAAVVVELEVINQADAPLVLEPAAILLAWGELEYAPEPPGLDAAAQPRTIEVPAGQAARCMLRYQLGRALTRPGARLIVRASSRGGIAIVDLPQLELPPIPTR